VLRRTAQQPLKQRQTREQEPGLIDREVLYFTAQQMPRDVEVRAFVGVPAGISGNVRQA
jgi:hypothetical protein